MRSGIITFHYESCNNQNEVIEKIKSCGKKAGLAIKPSTPAFVLEPFIGKTDMILIMTVEPGFGGQKLIPDTLSSVKTGIRDGKSPRGFTGHSGRWRNKSRKCRIRCSKRRKCTCGRICRLRSRRCRICNKKL